MPSTTQQGWDVIPDSLSFRAQGTAIMLLSSGYPLLGGSGGISDQGFKEDTLSHFEKEIFCLTSHNLK